VILIYLNIKSKKLFCNEMSFDCIFDLYKWNFLSNRHAGRVRSVDFFVRLNPHAINSLEIKYAALGSQIFRKRAIQLYFNEQFA
jgi:hypothetical protein